MKGRVPVQLKAAVIEDNENNRYLLRLLLEHAGFEVIAAVDGKSGIDMARREGPDVILLDIQMPEMDGYEVAAAIKRDPVLARVPIIGVSSFAMPGDRDKAMRSGFAGYIEKPVDPEGFAQSVTMFLNDARNRDENSKR
jgi:two-component system, cell cycle response regulator DivK